MDTATCRFKIGDFVTIAFVHRQHGYNIKINKGRIAKVTSIEPTKVRIQFQSGTRARISPKYLEPYVREEYDPDDLNHKFLS